MWLSKAFFFFNLHTLLAVRLGLERESDHCKNDLIIDAPVHRNKYQAMCRHDDISVAEKDDVWQKFQVGDYMKTSGEYDEFFKDNVPKQYRPTPFHPPEVELPGICGGQNGGEPALIESKSPGHFSKMVVRPLTLGSSPEPDRGSMFLIVHYSTDADSERSYMVTGYLHRELCFDKKSNVYVFEDIDLEDLGTPTDEMKTTLLLKPTESQLKEILQCQQLQGLSWAFNPSQIPECSSKPKGDHCRNDLIEGAPVHRNKYQAMCRHNDISVAEKDDVWNRFQIGDYMKTSGEYDELWKDNVPKQYSPTPFNPPEEGLPGICGGQNGGEPALIESKSPGGYFSKTLLRPLTLGSSPDPDRGSVFLIVHYSTDVDAERTYMVTGYLQRELCFDKKSKLYAFEDIDLEDLGTPVHEMKTTLLLKPTQHQLKEILQCQQLQGLSWAFNPSQIPECSSTSE